MEKLALSSMNKSRFLADRDVNGFVDWLAKQLNNKKLSHHYEVPSGKNIIFNGLEDAFKQYDWPFKFDEPPAPVSVRSGHTYSDNDTALTILCVGIRGEVATLVDSGVRDWAVAIMEWGGVRNGNVTWLNSNVSGLAHDIAATKALLQSGDDDKVTLSPIRRFNAGMTKVYSLLVPDFIIYDSRVAAALTWLVVHWCQDTKRSGVPSMLRFPCMRPKEGDNPAIRKLRNPSCGNFSFPWMNNHRINHAHWNIRASWVLSEALSKASNTQFHKQSKPLRALEAALFMWGYDLSKNSPCGTYPDEDHDENVEPEKDIELQESLWQKSSTLGGANAAQFEWCLDPKLDSVIIKRENGSIEHFKAGEIFQIIHALYDIFGFDWFPLANSITNMPKRTEKPGLGSTIYASGKGDVSHAQAASQLGVVLTEVGIFEFRKQKSITWRLRVEPPTSIQDLKMIAGF